MFRNLIRRKKKLFLAIILILILFTLLNPKTNNQQSLQSKPSISSTSDAETVPYIIKHFQVFSNSCKIPRVDPFSVKVQSFFKPQKLKNCSNEPDLFKVRFNERKKRYILYLTRTPSIYIYDYGCLYYEISHKTKDISKWNTKPIPFEETLIVPRHFQGIVVECHKLSNVSHILQRDAFSFVQYPSNRNEKNDKKRFKTHPSVIMIGIGSMSQINFQRTMPLTAQFMRELGAFEMRGYTKTADNTLLDTLAMLTGKYQFKCNVQDPECLDARNFIWTSFKNVGYLTALAEDIPILDFKRQPKVDYYLQPFLSVIQRIMGGVKRSSQDLDFCLGRRHLFQYVLDYCSQLVERFVHKSSKPVFGIFWTNSFSQDDFQAAASIDKIFVAYLQRFKKLGLFERSVFILVSDQGQNHGPLMRLKSRFLEERLPMLHIHLPKWYQDKIPSGHIWALQLNSRQLSTPLDLYCTLFHLLVFLNPRWGGVECFFNNQSLLYIRPNRSCTDAVIPHHLCPCEPYALEPKSDTMQNLAKLVVYRMNQYLSRNDFDEQCHRLEFAKLWSAERMQHYGDNGSEVAPPDGVNTYLLKFSTRPKGMFMATASCNEEGNVVNVRTDQIDRLSPELEPSKQNGLQIESFENLCICK